MGEWGCATYKYLSQILLLSSISLQVQIGHLLDHLENMVHLQSLQLRTTCLPCSRISQVPSCPSQSIRCIPRPIVAARVAVRAAATADDEEESGSAVSGEWPVNWSLASYEDVGEFFQNNLFKQGASPASSLAEVMSKSVTTTNPEASIDSVKSLFDRISGVPVVKSTTDPTLVGVLSKKDLNKSGSKVKDLLKLPNILLSLQSP